MKKHLYILGCLFGLLAAGSCSQDKEQGAGKPVLEITALADAAHFGDNLPFTVQVSDEVPLSTVAVRLLFGDEKVAETTIRTKENGSYSGNIAIPFLQDIADGNARLEFVLTNTSVTKVSEVKELALSRPVFPYLVLVTETDTYSMLPTGEPNEYAVSKSFPSTELPAYFKAPAVGENGKELTFGWEAGKIELGVTENIPLYSTEGGKFTVTFNTMTYKATPFFEVFINGQQLSMMDKENLKTDIDVKKGEEISVTGTTDFSGWWFDPDFFKKDGDKYTFVPIDGKYRFIANIPHKYFRVQVIDGDKTATLKDDGTGAVWVIGENIGKPSVANNQVGWSPENALCLAPIGNKKYQITVVAGQQVNTNALNFKFFYQMGWGNAFQHTGSTEEKETGRITSSSSDIIIKPSGGGNLDLAAGVTLEDGVTYVLTVDLSAGNDKAVLNVEKK